MPGPINTSLFDKARTKLGVKPAVPPFYEPETVVRVFLYAAEHPSRDLNADSAAKMQATMEKPSPRALEKHPLARGVATVAAVGTLAALAALVMRRGD